MIRSIDDSNKYKQPELVSPTSTALLRLGPSIKFYIPHNPSKTRLFGYAYNQQNYCCKTNHSLESSCTTSINWCL